MMDANTGTWEVNRIAANNAPSPVDSLATHAPSPGQRQGPTLPTLNRPRKHQPLTPKAFQNTAEGQPRCAGAPPSDTDRPKPPDPERVPQWSPCCAPLTGLALGLAHVTSRGLLSPFTIQHSAFAAFAARNVAVQLLVSDGKRRPDRPAKTKMNFAKRTQKYALATTKTPIFRKKRTQMNPLLMGEG